MHCIPALIQSLAIEPKSSGSSVCGGVNISNKHYNTTGVWFRKEKYFTEESGGQIATIFHNIII
jgi:hypothetical protein